MLPRISIVTPSFNSGRFVRKTVTSILSQNYDNLEYIFQDGGSTDDTLKIIQDYHPSIYQCVSERDSGQYDAINRGFHASTGEIMAWLNADDVYLPNTLHLVAKIFAKFPQIQWLTTTCPLVIDEEGQIIYAGSIPGYSRQGFLQGDNLPTSYRKGTGFIQQESTFWRRSLWTQAGGYVDSKLDYAGDFELWGRFFQYADLYAVTVPLACFRKHGTQKTSCNYQGYINEAEAILAKFQENTIKERVSQKPKSVIYNWESLEWNIIENEVESMVVDKSDQQRQWWKKYFVKCLGYNKV